MITSDYLPKNDLKLLQWVTNFLNYISVTLARYGFPLEVYEKLEALRNDFKAKLDVAETPSSRTKMSIQAKNTAKKVLKAAVRQATKEYLTYNHLVTDEDRDGMGIPIHKTTHTPAQVAKTYPIGRADTSMLRRIIIHFANQSDGEETSKAKPPGQHGAEIRWALSEVPVIDVAELTHSSFDTRTPFTLEFQGHERGKTIYFALCWENTRGEKGPYSPIESAIIP
jgi:hypothetical protein